MIHPTHALHRRTGLPHRGGAGGWGLGADIRAGGRLAMGLALPARPLMSLSISLCVLASIVTIDIDNTMDHRFAGLPTVRRPHGLVQRRCLTIPCGDICRPRSTDRPRVPSQDVSFLGSARPPSLALLPHPPPLLGRFQHFFQKETWKGERSVCARVRDGGAGVVWGVGWMGESVRDDVVPVVPKFSVYQLRCTSYGVRRTYLTYFTYLL